MQADVQTEPQPRPFSLAPAQTPPRSVRPLKKKFSRFTMYDIIGDIHGYADELVELLERLGYREINGIFRHSNRFVIYCGDFIDRGPQISDVLKISRSMVEGGSAQAVMGNHEFNAIAFHTERLEQPGTYFRQHTAHNIRQHAATTQQLTQSELQNALDWFRQLPVALDLEQLRVVHACWDPAGIAIVQQGLDELGRFSPAFLEQASEPRNPVFENIERLLKGPEIRLPDGITVKDKEGSDRKRIRIRWFERPDGHTLASYALPAVNTGSLTSIPLTAPCHPAPYDRDHPPVFIGHYWMPDKTPQPLAHNVACLDYSVAKDGQLCAYRFDGETRLNATKFVTVASRGRQ